MTAFAGGLIECHAGPTEKGAPDDLETVIVEFIDGARRELQVAVQELDNEPIARALVRAKLERGVDVEVFLEQDYLREAWTAADLDRMRTPGESDVQAVERLVWGGGALPLDDNRRLLGALLRAKIDVKADLNPAIFHQKFAVRDVHGGAGTEPALLSGSANFTGTDTHANLNHVVVFRDQRIAQEYYSQFNQLKDGDFGRGELSRDPAPRLHARGRPRADPVRARQPPRAGAGQADAQAAPARRPPPLRHLHVLQQLDGGRRAEHARQGRLHGPRGARPRPEPHPPVVGRLAVARAECRAVPAQVELAAAQGPPQADGHRRRGRVRGLVQLHVGRQRLQRREPVRDRQRRPAHRGQAGRCRRVRAHHRLLPRRDRADHHPLRRVGAAAASQR